MTDQKDWDPPLNDPKWVGRGSTATDSVEEERVYDVKESFFFRFRRRAGTFFKGLGDKIKEGFGRIRQATSFYYVAGVKQRLRRVAIILLVVLSLGAALYYGWKKYTSRNPQTMATDIPLNPEAAYPPPTAQSSAPASTVGTSAPVSATIPATQNDVRLLTEEIIRLVKTLDAGQELSKEQLAQIAQSINADKQLSREQHEQLLKAIQANRTPEAPRYVAVPPPPATSPRIPSEPAPRPSPPAPRVEPEAAPTEVASPPAQEFACSQMKDENERKRCEIWIDRR